MSEFLAVAVRFGLYLSLMTGFGMAAFALYAPREAARRLPLGTSSIVSALAAIGLSGVGLVILAAAMEGVGLNEVDRAAVSGVLLGTGAGTALMFRVAALCAMLVTACFRTGIPAAGLAALGAVALATLAWSGHGAADDGLIGWVHLGADIAHLVAAGTWLGGLLALLLLLMGPPTAVDAPGLRVAHRTLDGFSTVGTIVVATIVVTGAISGWLLVGSAGIPTLGSTLYGRLLLAKLALFVVMLLLAWANRFRLTPALDRALLEGDVAGALAALRRSLALEATCAAGVLAAVAWLGTLDPTATS